MDLRLFYLAQVVINLASKKLPTINATHEVVHTMDKSEVKKLYEDIMATDKNFAKSVVSEYQNHPSANEYTEDMLAEEVVARFMEGAVTDHEKLIKQVEGSVSLGERIVGFFKGLKSQKENIPKSQRAELNRIYNRYVDALSLARAKGEIAKERGSSVKVNKKTEASVSFSIKTIDGKDIVVIDTDQDIFDGVAVKDYGKVVKEYIKSHYRGKVVNGVAFKRFSEKEYTSSRDSQRAFNRENGTYDTKMRLATELDNLIRTGKYVAHEEAKHPHNYNEGGFDRYGVEFVLKDKRFSGEMLFAIDKDRKVVFYDVIKIKESNLLNTSTKLKGEQMLSNIIIRKTSAKVNTETKKSEETVKRQYSLADIDKYTETQYNSFGWVVVNDVLSMKEYKLFNEKLAELTMSNGYFPRTFGGEYTLAVGNKLVYTSKNYDKPTISQVVEVQMEDYDELSEILKDIYSYEKEGIKYERWNKAIKNIQGEGIILQHNREDWSTYKELKASRQTESRASDRYWNGKPRGYNFEDSDGNGGKTQYSLNSSLSRTYTKADATEIVESLYDEVFDRYGVTLKGKGRTSSDIYDMMNVAKSGEKTSLSNKLADLIIARSVIKSSELEFVQEEDAKTINFIR